MYTLYLLGECIGVAEGCMAFKTSVAPLEESVNVLVDTSICEEVEGTGVLARKLVDSSVVVVAVASVGVELMVDTIADDGFITTVVGRGDDDDVPGGSVSIEDVVIRSIAVVEIITVVAERAVAVRIGIMSFDVVIVDVVDLTITLETDASKTAVLASALVVVTDKETVVLGNAPMVEETAVLDATAGVDTTSATAGVEVAVVTLVTKGGGAVVGLGTAEIKHCMRCKKI